MISLKNNPGWLTMRLVKGCVAIGSVTGSVLFAAEEPVLELCVEDGDADAVVGEVVGVAVGSWLDESVEA